MKTPFVPGLIALLLFAGCGDKSAAPAPAPATNAAASSGNPLTAPADYLGALNRGQQSAVKTIDIASINQAIQMFEVDKGRKPKDLNELVQEKFLVKIPAAPYGMKIVYDATTGKVSVVKE